MCCCNTQFADNRRSKRDLTDLVSQDSPLPGFTVRQTEILQSVVRGYANKNIAKQFGISEAGVKKHLRLIFAKFGASNRSEAVAIALRKHLLKI